MPKRNREQARYHLSEQQTAPIPAPAVQLSVASIPPFPGYLEQHHLTVIEVARAASVPAVTVWRIAHGRAVSSVHAHQVRIGVFRLTGVLYTGPIETIR